MYTYKKDDRNFVIYLLLSILTFGIYSIYFWYSYTEDLNQLLKGDGKESPNYIIVWFLSCITFGIYGIWWRCRQADRLFSGAPLRYQITIRESGSFLLVWLLMGYLTYGIGTLAAHYFLIHNLNLTASAHNKLVYARS